LIDLASAGLNRKRGRVRRSLSLSTASGSCRNMGHLEEIDTDEGRERGGRDVNEVLRMLSLKTAVTSGNTSTGRVR
jgi:hypothetical protein